MGANPSFHPLLEDQDILSRFTPLFFEVPLYRKATISSVTHECRNRHPRRTDGVLFTEGAIAAFTATLEKDSNRILSDQMLLCFFLF